MSTDLLAIARKETNGSLELPSRQFLRRSHTSPTNRQYPDFGSGSPSSGSCHHSISADFDPRQGSPHSLPTDLDSSKEANPDRAANPGNHRRIKGRNGNRIVWRWSRMRAGVLRGKMLSVEPLERKRSADALIQPHEDMFSGDESKHLDVAAECSREESNTKLNPRMELLPRQPQSLIHKYQPKVFEEIIGHEMIVKALSNAIQSKRISPLYLFHGPGGTGKTSAAKIFGMMLNCESISTSKPCWACTGCSRSLYMADLCSGSRTITDFGSIETLLHSTAFKHTFPGFKVFIVDGCHSLPEDSWGRLLNMTEEQENGCSLVFIIIAEDTSTVPRSVSSRCQKFCFAKLMDTDVLLKLSRIAAQERIEIRNDDLQLIAKIADGNIREAENIMDQLALLGQTITTSMVQQLAGLIPRDKMIQLLEVALRGDSTEAMRRVRDLIMHGTEPRAIVLQLAAFITEIFPGSSSFPLATQQNKISFQTLSTTREIDPERLCQALKILIETEKQLRMFPCNHATWVSAALLQIASYGSSKHNLTSTSQPKDSPPTEDKLDMANINKAGPSNHIYTSATSNYQPSNSIIEQSKNKVNQNTTGIDMEEVWQSILESIENKRLSEFLRGRTELISFTISRANAIVHLMLKHSDQKGVEMSEESISNDLRAAIGCPVTVNISHEPMQPDDVPKNVPQKQVSGSSHSEQHQTQILEVFEPSRSLNYSGHVPRQNASQKSALNLESRARSTRRQNSGYTSGQINELTRRRHGNNSTEHIPILSGRLNQASRNTSLRNMENQHGGDQTHDKISIARAEQLKNRFLSLSSIPRTDASIEPYSQDLLFEAVNTDRIRGSRKSKLYQHLQMDPDRLSIADGGLDRSWSCTHGFCRGGPMVKENVMGPTTNKSVMKRTSSCNVPNNRKL